jgi:hypothetical protein
MSIALRTKYLSIKKEKLSETGKTVLKSMYDATDGFKDAKATRKIKPKFEAFYDKLKKSKPEAIKGATKPKETPTAKQFKEARERRKSQTGVPKKDSDIKRDADRPAIDRKGKRVTDGTHYPYKKGNVYYEYRDNRYDKRPAKYPKLEDGGMMADGGVSDEVYTKGYQKYRSEEIEFSINYKENGKMKEAKIKSHFKGDAVEEWRKKHPNAELIGVYEKVRFSKKEDGGMMAKGGMTPGRWYKDNQGNEFKYIGEDMSGKSLFNDGERTMHKTLDDFEPNVKETKLFGWFGDGGYMDEGAMIYKMADNMTDAQYEEKLSSLNEKQKKSYESLVRLGDSPKLALATTLLSKEANWSDETKRAYTMAKGGEMLNGGEEHRSDGGDQLFADGGKVDNGNVEMVMSNTKAIEHHAQELKKLVDMNTPIEAWVVAKLERAETDLSDVTHYIDGLKSAKFEDGGEVEGHDVEIFFNTKDKVADPYTVIVDGSVYSMSGTTGPYSVNLYVGEIDEFSPQAVKSWGKKINFVNADPELISQIESRFEDEMADGGETSKFEVDDVVYHKGFNTVGIVRIAEERGEVKTDADGNVNADELEYYNPMKHESHKSAKIAPSTYKEVEERGLWQPFSERTSTLANGGYLAEKTSVEVGNEKISVIKRRKEKTGYPVYVNTQGYAPMTLDVYPTKELAIKKAKALANKEGYSYSNWEKVGEFKLEPYAKGGRLSRKQKQLDLNKNGKLDSQDFKMLRAKRKNARKK